MAVISTSGSETIGAWLTDFNSLSTVVGDAATLTTDVTTDLVAAINSLKTDVNNLEGSLGGLDFTPYLKNDSAFTKTVGDITLNDNISLYIGTDQDLRLWHNGTNSYIDDLAGTGSLYIRSNQVLIRSPAGENMIVATENGSAALYYDNAKKLETSATGVDVTGGIAVTGSAIISGVIASDVDTQSMIVYGGNGTGGHIELYGGSHSTLANDINYDADQHNFRTQSGTATFTVDVSGNITATGNITTSTGALSVGGNITVGGTVDGRDIATNIPASLGTAGQVLTVNTGATATEWTDLPQSGNYAAVKNLTAAGNGDVTPTIDAVGVTRILIDAYWAPTNNGLNGDATLTLEGSNDESIWTDIQSQSLSLNISGSGTVSFQEYLDSAVGDTVYDYYRARVFGDGDFNGLLYLEARLNAQYEEVA